MRQRLFLRSSIVLLLLLAGRPALAQAPKPAPESDPETFYESIDVEVVNVEVFVTDRRGNRVAGLTKDDFELFEDGKPVDLTYFYAVGSEIPSLEEPPAEGTPAAEAAAQAAAPGPDQRLHLAIVFDGLSLTPQGRNRLLQSIRSAVLPLLHPSDLTLVADYRGGGSFEIVQELTSDRAKLESALAAVEKSVPRGVERATEWRQLLIDLERASITTSGQADITDSSRMFASSLYGSIVQYGQQRYDEARTTLEALGGFVDSLSGLPGRKALLYVGGGLSVRPGQALLQAWQTKLPELMEDAGASPLDMFGDSLTPKLRQLTERANANRVTFYTLGSTELPGLGADSPGGFAWTAEMQNTERLNLSESLDRLASDTGGLSAVDLVDPRTILNRMRDDFDSYYSLGYVPQRRRDGKSRPIQVKVRNRDLVVRHRTAHRERTSAERMTDHTLAALLLGGGAQENPLEVSLELVKETRGKDGRIQLDLVVKFPLAKLVLLPREQFHEARATIYVASRDGKGRVSPVQKIDIPFRVPNDQLLTALGQTAGYKTSLLLRAEEHILAVGVRDELGHVEAATTARYKPGV
ncbi:MAG TPA: VWA domain-containing protein [Thermoanaerobaculia bacterium]